MVTYVQIKVFVKKHVLKNTITCSAAIRDLHYNQAGHSCKDIRDSGDSKGDGEYWIDPENKGNPLKVFCDMTTEGGKILVLK